MLPIRSLPFTVILAINVSISGCAVSRQIAIDYPNTQSSAFQPLPGFEFIDGDDYYVQILSEFEFTGDNVLKTGCNDHGPTYESGDLSAALVYDVRNEPLKFKREATGFLYQGTTGKCNFRFDAKKVYLTPWIRLDSGQDTVTDYNFYSSANSDVNVSGLVDDINTASNLLALTGVGTGIAVMGKLATGWAQNNPQTLPQTPAMSKHSSESHSLPVAASFSSKTGALKETRFSVYEVLEGGLSFGPETKPLGELKVYPQILASLLLKIAPNGLPDARDLSLPELWRSKIKTAGGDINLQQLIEQTEHDSQPNIHPSWDNYAEVESDCRKLKLVLKDLGFNKFDRNAVLYYFLDNSRDWRNYNITAQRAAAGDIRPKVLENNRAKDFGGCLAADDYSVMKVMGLMVNTSHDWTQIVESMQNKEKALSPILSFGRQLAAAIKNPNIGEMQRQVFPLLHTVKGGQGTVLLQNHLGEFGLEKLLNIGAVGGEGVIVDAGQIAQIFSALGIEQFSCARPAPGQGQAISNIGILLFSTKEGSPRAKGGALEFEFADGKITRLAFQHPSYRDFEQDVLDRPDVGGCRIDAEFIATLH